ncbi:hypothetical protein BC332_32463 [Capsicum chinense]|nr:hypothetical protein BC332_32463 [Capsicum chinense]
MPKSKRNRAVTLSKTKKKGKEHKENIVNSIRECAEKYSSVFFLGSNKVMQVALGRSVADEIRSGLHKISKLVRGDSGLCFTNLSKEEVQRKPGFFECFVACSTSCFSLLECDPCCLPTAPPATLSFLLIILNIVRLFNQYEEYDFARTGTIATEKVDLQEGPLDQFTHEMEPFLRKQGMPVRLKRGVVELVSDYVVCEEGKPLSPEAARILRLLGIKMATFRLNLICRWSPDEFELYREGLEESDIESS